MNRVEGRQRLGLTESVCPECLAAIPAERFVEADTVYLTKTCSEHGQFTTPVWRGLRTYLKWGRGARAHSQPTVCATEAKNGCPHDCGLCPSHRQQSCCVLLEITSRCDIACPVCFASAGQNGRDADLAEIDGWLATLLAAGGRMHIQLSGGEPTVRDDLPDIVRLVRARGFDFVQLNTNGIRLAKEPDYVATLRDAGLDCVFLQFDGVSNDVHMRLRGAKLACLKEHAIRNCGEAGIGVVLVPTVMRGVNDHEIGAIVDFAVARLPAVRAVHFQPVSFFGRCPAPDDRSRITLSEIVEALVEHCGTIRFDDFNPGSAENPYCSFSGRFHVDRVGRLRAAATATASCCGTPVEPAMAMTRDSCCGGAPAAPDASPCCGPAVGDVGRDRDAAEASTVVDCCGSVRPSRDVARARRYVAGQWTSPEHGNAPVSELDSFDLFLAGRERTLGLSGMAFQDAWTLDLERLRQCHIHIVAPDRRVIPFCAWNLTDRNGRPLYRPGGGTAAPGY